MWEAAKELNVDHSMVVRCLKQVGKMTRLNKWADCKKKKNHHFELLSSLILLNNKPFLNQIVTCDEKWILYDNQLSGWTEKEAPKHFPKPNFHTKKVMVTVWWSAACLIHYNLLNPSETVIAEKYTQQIDEMHQELQCLKAALVNRTSPVLLHNAGPHVAQPVLQSWTNLAMKFCLTHHIHLTSCQPTSTSLSSFTTFCRENASTTNLRQKILAKSSLNTTAQIFMLQE